MCIRDSIRTFQNTNRNRFVNLEAYTESGNRIYGEYGKIQINNGTIEIEDIASSSFILTIPFSKSYFTSKSNNIINLYQTGVEIL